MRYPPIYEPTSVTVVAGNICITINDPDRDHPLTTVQPRAVALVFEDGNGDQMMVPLSATNAVRIGHDLLREGSEAANAFDEDELEDIEIEVTLSRTVETP